MTILTAPEVVFDTTTGMLRATAAFLHGRAFPRLGPPPPVPLLQPSRFLPRLFHGKTIESPADGDPDKLAERDAEAVAGWMVSRYPKRRYPAVAVGSTNGAVVHLCAALGIPWLPQAFSVPVRQPPRLQEAEDRRSLARPLAFYRVSQRKLGGAYKAFLSGSVAAGGSVLVVTRARGGSPPRSEGTLEPSLREELLDLARRRGLAVVQLVFHEPEDLSPLVADLYGWWYRRRSIVARRLLASSVIVTDPLWTLRLGAVPFWLEYIAEPSAATLEHYLEMRPPFDYINLCLFRHGAENAGLPPVERWQGILAHAKRRGDFVGVDAASYPADFSSFTRYQDAIKRIPARFPVPPPLPLEDFGGFLRHARRYRVAVEPVDGAVRWLG